MQVAPYGSWSSPVSIDMLTSDTVRISSLDVDGDEVYWIEARADQGGRSSLWRQGPDGVATELTGAPFYARNRVHEYGGGEYGVRDGVVVVSSFADGRLYRLRVDAEPVPITPAADLRFADVRVYPSRGLVLAVREDHRGTGEAVNTIVALDLGGADDDTQNGDGPTEGLNDDGGRVLLQGADFYSSPELAADSRLAWVQWDHPQMPWDATTLHTATLDGDTVSDVATIAGGQGESAVQPRWTPSGTLIFVSDRSNWWNLYACEADGAIRALHPAEAEFCGPQWQLGQRAYAVVDDDLLLCTWSRNGASSLGRLSVSTGELTPVPDGAGATSVAANDQLAAVAVGFEAQPSALVRVELADWTPTTLRRAASLTVAADAISVAEPVSWSSPQGPVFGWFYPPTNPDFTGPPDELCPLITSSHGGPTGFASAQFDLSVQYWTSRGIGVLDVNYGGSTGYGRAYRERLKGQWGLVDVDDCANGALAMGEQGRADPARLAIKGGSAGGYTTLRALTATEVFAAGISLYGVGDLTALAEDTHKFESRYLDGLVGPYPQAAAVYRDRSPIAHVDDLSAPILILQGDEDRVVPLNQAETMAEAARAKGLAVALIVFTGEGHGFRRAENVRASVQAQLYFLGQVFDFTPADALPVVTIDNRST